MSPYESLDVMILMVNRLMWMHNAHSVLAPLDWDPSVVDMVIFLDKYGAMNEESM